jgi:hypothetical protein
VLHLGEVKIRAKPPLDALLGVMKEVEAKIKDATTDGLTVDQKMRFIQVPAPSSHDQSGDSIVKFIILPVGGFEGNLSANSVPHVDLAIEIIEPGRCMRV